MPADKNSRPGAWNTRQHEKRCIPSFPAAGEFTQHSYRGQWLGAGDRPAALQCPGMGNLSSTSTRWRHRCCVAFETTIEAAGHPQLPLLSDNRTCPGCNKTVSSMGFFLLPAVKGWPETSCNNFNLDGNISETVRTHDTRHVLSLSLAVMF